jgi:hypothetical protein
MSIRKLVTTLAFCSLLGAGSALAAASSVTGQIKSIDATNHAITLESGEVITFGAKMSLKSFKVGEKVVATYETDKDGKMMGTKIKATK